MLEGGGGRVLDAGGRTLGGSGGGDPLLNDSLPGSGASGVSGGGS